MLFAIGFSLPKSVEATFSSVTGRGRDNQTGSASSLSVSPTANITVGKIAIVQAVSDNDDITEGATTFHTLSDTDGNTWTRVYEETDTAGSADDGSTTSLWWSEVATQIDTTDSITVTYGGGSGSLTDATIAVFEATITAGNTITFVTPASTHIDDSATSISDTQGSLDSREYLLVGSFGAEGEDNIKTEDADYTVLYDLNSTGAGLPAVNIESGLQYRIATLTTDTVTTSDVDFTNGTQTLVAFYEVSPPITVSGTIKQTDESANYDCSAVTAVTVHASVNGGAISSNDCTASTFSITATDPGAADIPVSVFIDSGEGIKGTTVTLSSAGATNIINLDIFVDRLIVTQESATAITNSHLATADTTGDAGIRYSVSAGALTVESAIELHVKSSKTYTSGGTVTTQGGADMHVDDSATVTLANATNTIADDLLVDGGATINIDASTTINGGDITTSGTSAIVTTTSGTPTVTMSGNGSIGGGTTPTLTFYNLSTTGSGTTTIANSTTFNNVVSVGAGTTLTIGASMTGGVSMTTSSTGIINYTGTPTVTLSGAGTIGNGSGSITFYNLTTNGTSNNTNMNSTITVDNALSVGASHTFAMGTNSLTIGSTSISDSGDITIATGASTTHTSGTVTILGNSGNAADWSGPGELDVADLVIGNDSTTFTVDNVTNDLPLDIAGNFTLNNAATFQAASTTTKFQVAGNWLVDATSAVFTAGDGIVTLDSGSGGPTITSGGDSFNNLSIDNGGTAITWTLQDALDVNGNLLIDTSNTLDANSGGPYNVNVAGNWTNNGTFTHRNNTVTLDGAADSTQTIDGNTTFYNLTATGGDRILQFGVSDTFTISSGGTFTLTGDSNCTALLVIRSTTADGVFNITNTGATESFSYVDFQGAQFSDATSASNSVNSGNNDQITIAANACISSSTNSTATASGYSFQRKTFYDSENSSHWLFVHDGDEIEVRYSSDGTSWSNPATVASGHLAYDTNDFSVWWSSISTVEYVWLAVASGDDILIRRGTLSTTDITWDADVVTAFDAGGADTYSYPYFSLDSSNYMWAGARYYDATNYVYKTVRSDVNDTGDATWDINIGFGTTVTVRQISDDQTDDNVIGNLIPLASQSMLAVVVKNTAIESCVWDPGVDLRWENQSGASSCEGASGTQDSVATTINSGSSIEYNISAVSDASSPNDVHLLYLDNSSPVKVVYKRWDNNGASSAWQSAFTVDETASTTNLYVSLTMDTTTKDLWTAWIDQTGDDDVYYRQCDVTTLTSECDTATPWLTRTSESTATGAVYNSLDTNYASADRAFAIWTNTSASPFAVTWSSLVAPSGNSPPSAPSTLFTNETDTGAGSGVADPVGVGDSTPVFSAVNVDSDQGDVADKYEVIVYSDVSCATEVWDSGAGGTAMTSCTEGNRCSDINFGGTDLALDGTKYYWKIKHWDDSGEAGTFSGCTDNFTMLSPSGQLRHGNYFFNQTTERKFTW